MEPTVHDVLTFHRLDRAAYDYLVALGAGRQSAPEAVALFMWLHRRACAGAEAIPRLPGIIFTPADAARLVSETRAVLGGSAALTEPLQLIPFLCGSDAGRVRGLLAQNPADVMRRGVAEVIDGSIGALVFDDRLHELMWRYEEGGGGGGPLSPALAAPYRSSWGASGAAQQPEDDGRSLFVTFSKGEPLTHEEIVMYFAAMWGDCVERVMMERTPLGEPPSYGRIILRSAAAVAAILMGQQRVKLVVNGRQMWARKYVPR